MQPSVFWSVGEETGHCCQISTQQKTDEFVRRYEKIHLRKNEKFANLRFKVKNSKSSKICFLVKLVR